MRLIRRLRHWIKKCLWHADFLARRRSGFLPQGKLGASRNVPVAACWLVPGLTMGNRCESLLERLAVLDEADMI
ncbi:hypothetical protein BDW71DRAFT_180083 [Aspergillus fruticulosus]